MIQIYISILKQCVTVLMNGPKTLLRSNCLLINHIIIIIMLQPSSSLHAYSATIGFCLSFNATTGSLKPGGFCLYLIATYITRRFRGVICIPMSTTVATRCVEFYHLH
eukprot:PhF_6_TR22379/c0_g1_i1/m.31738